MAHPSRRKERFHKDLLILQDRQNDTNREMFGLDDGAVTAGSTISKIEVRAWVGKGTAAATSVSLSYQRIGPDLNPVDSGTIPVTGSSACDQLISSTWRGLSWTPAHLDSLEIGISHVSGGKVNVSQIYVTVSYDSASTKPKIVSWREVEPQ